MPHPLCATCKVDAVPAPTLHDPLYWMVQVAYERTTPHPFIKRADGKNICRACNKSLKRGWHTSEEVLG